MNLITSWAPKSGQDWPGQDISEMKEDDIYRLFMSVINSPSQDTDAIKEVFSILVRSTLRYRDRMLETKGIVITVEDVRSALDWLVPALTGGGLPRTGDKVRLDLLRLWLDELRYIGNPYS